MAIGVLQGDTGIVSSPKLRFAAVAAPRDLLEDGR